MKYISTILLLLISFCSFGQGNTTYQSALNTTVQYHGGLGATKRWVLPMYGDTTAANSYYSTYPNFTKKGNAFYDTTDKVFWIHDGGKWVQYLNIEDTSTVLATKADLNNIPQIDTTALSNRINLKEDLSNKRTSLAGANSTTYPTTRAVTDTLQWFVRIDDTNSYVATKANLNTKVSYSDTSTVIATKANISIPSGRVPYGSGTGITSEAAFTYNETTNTIFSDSANLRHLTVRGLSNDTVPVRIYLTSPSGARYNSVAIRATESGIFPTLSILNVDSVGKITYVWGSSGNGITVDRATTHEYVLMVGSPANPGRIVFENTGVNGANFSGVIDENENWFLGNGSTNKPHRLYVEGSAKVKDTFYVCDEGHGFAHMRPGNYQDNSSYVEGVGWKFDGITKGGIATILTLDSIGRIWSGHYRSTHNDGYTKVALAPDAAGYIGARRIFDTTSGTQNGDQVIYWTGTNTTVPTSSAGLKYNSSTGLEVNNKIRVTDTILLQDRGTGWAIFKTRSYQNNPNYVQGVGIRFMVKNISGDIIGARLDSLGNFTVAGTSTVTTDNAAYNSGWNGSLKLTTENAVYDAMIDTVWRKIGSDSVFFRKGGTTRFAFRDSIGTGGGGVADGDKGDITVSSSGSVWTIDNNAVTNAKINDVAWSKITGAPSFLTTESDPVFSGSDAATIDATDISNWNDAYAYSQVGHIPLSGSSAIAGHLIPGTNEAYSIGSSIHAFDKGYFRNIFTNKDIEVLDHTAGLILKDSNGARWRITVGTDGSLQVNPVP